MVGEAFRVQLGDDHFARVDVPWRLGAPDPVASSLLLPALPPLPPTHVSGPWQSPTRSVMRTTLELWYGRRPQPERWLQSGVRATPQVRAKGQGLAGHLSLPCGMCWRHQDAPGGPPESCQHRARGPDPARAAPRTPRPEGCGQGPRAAMS